MHSKEAIPHPTGRFPNFYQEMHDRYNFLDKENPLLIKIRARLKELDLKGKRNLPLNILSLCYGLHFYNRLCRYQLYSHPTDPPINIIRDSSIKYSVYAVYGKVTINLDPIQSTEQFKLAPLQTAEVYENSSIYAPSYLAQILTGIEEASHLHLETLHQEHTPNHCHQSDHARPYKLWQESGYDPFAYRAKLWHEFAILPVQRAYLNYYFAREYPDTVAEFNHFYTQVKSLRRRWIKRKRQNH
jgi:hypothetical protein